MTTKSSKEPETIQDQNEGLDPFYYPDANVTVWAKDKASADKKLEDLQSDDGKDKV